MTVLKFNANEVFEEIVVEVGDKKYTVSDNLPLAILVGDDEKISVLARMAKIFDTDMKEFENMDARVAMKIVRSIMATVGEQAQGKSVNPTAAGAPSAK